MPQCNCVAGRFPWGAKARKSPCRTTWSCSFRLRLAPCFLRVKRRRPYGMLTFTRKNLLAAFVGTQSPSVRLSRPSTVYTRSCFVPHSFKSGSQPTTGPPSAPIEITARNESDPLCGAGILAQSPPCPQSSDYRKGGASSPSESSLVENQQVNEFAHA